MDSRVVALRMVQPDVIREKAHLLPQALAVFAKAVCLAAQRRQGLPQGQGRPFDQGGADRKAQVSQAGGSQHDAGAERQQCAMLLLFDQLSIDQSWMGRTDGLAWAVPLGGSSKRCADKPSLYG